jgi:hypothetical protein
LDRHPIKGSPIEVRCVLPQRFPDQLLKGATITSQSICGSRRSSMAGNALWWSGRLSRFFRT